MRKFCFFLIQIFMSFSIPAISHADSVVVIEDAEDGNTKNWKLIGSHKGASISNVSDPVNSSNRVIKINVKNSQAGASYVFKKPPRGSERLFKLQWRMKYRDPYIVEINCRTSRGNRTLSYTETDTNQLGRGKIVHHGLGWELRDGRWHTVRRDLQRDLWDVRPKCDIISVESFTVYGSGYIDDIIVMEYPDRDRDLIPNSIETACGMNPDNPSDGPGDIDQDKLENVPEIIKETAIDNPDSDSDELGDHFESDFSYTDPLSSDTDSNGTEDSAEDPDADSLSILEEQNAFMSPYIPAVPDIGYLYEQTVREKTEKSQDLIKPLENFEKSGNCVIRLKGKKLKTQYTCLFEEPERVQFKIQWRMKSGRPYIIYILCMTTRGPCRLYYTASDEDWLDSWSYYIHHGLGGESAAGGWITVRRDLQRDLWDAFPDCDILYVEAFIARGDVLIEDMVTLAYADLDRDLIPDYLEILLELDPTAPGDASGDLNGNGVSNLDEFLNGTILDGDSDGDQMSDKWELIHLFNPADPLDASYDSDFDGLTNLREYQLDTDPLNPDTDKDTALDGLEVVVGTNPLNPESFPVNVSGGIIYNGLQIGNIFVIAADSSSSWSSANAAKLLFPGAYIISNIPNLSYYYVKAYCDTNENGLVDFWEANGSCGSNPLYLTENAENINITLFDPDTDTDQLPDWWELRYLGGNLDPTPENDNDLDNLSNAEELAKGSDPGREDTDRDGFSDSYDENPLSRAFIRWGDPAFTVGDYYTYTNPEWLKRAWKEGGTWNSWDMSSSEPENTGFLYMELDRTILSCDVVMEIEYFDSRNSSLFVDLLSSAGVPLVSDLFGNIMTGTDALARKKFDIPLTTCPEAAIIRLRRGIGDIKVYETVIYVDKDHDGLDADQEAQLGTSDTEPDSDNDGLTDCDEVNTYNTNPANADSDNDGMPDGWELQFGLNPNADDASGDLDGDGTSNIEEYNSGADPSVSDRVDSDFDGLPDDWEMEHFGNLKQDALSDVWGDYDKDGLTNLQEYELGTNPAHGDTDGDWIKDYWEVQHGFNPNDPSDKKADPDNDGATNWEESWRHTDPFNADTDGDGLNDGYEIHNLEDPDMISPLVVDTDGDGLTDGYEVNQGSNPLDQEDEGVIPTETMRLRLEFGDKNYNAPFAHSLEIKESHGWYNETIPGPFGDTRTVTVTRDLPLGRYRLMIRLPEGGGLSRDYFVRIEEITLPRVDSPYICGYYDYIHYRMDHIYRCDYLGNYSDGRVSGYRSPMYYYLRGTYQDDGRYVAQSVAFCITKRPLSLNIDSNNDGRITKSDDETEEESPGNLVTVPLGEDELWTDKALSVLVLKRLAHPAFLIKDNLSAGTVKLKKISGDGEIRIWKNDGVQGIGKYSPVKVDPDTSRLIIDPSKPESDDLYEFFTNGTGENGYGDTPFFVEGLKVGEARLQVTYNLVSGEDYQDDVVLTVVPAVDLRTDLDRDGEIDFDSNADKTTDKKPYRFWINNDRDIMGEYVEEDMETDPWTFKDYQHDRIEVKRDLEDFSRLQLKIKGVPRSELVSGEYRVRLVPTISFPDINLFKYYNGSSEYLTDVEVADDLTGKPELLIEKDDMFDYEGWTVPGEMFDNPETTASFLFDGKRAGSGCLTVMIYDYNGRLVSDREIFHLEIKDIKDMYEHYYIGDIAGKSYEEINSLLPNDIPNTYNKPSDAFFYKGYSPETKDYILFVHGWRMKPYEKVYFAETSYKRLFWQGYKGRFGMVSWPTEWCRRVPNEHGGIPEEPQNYSRSERKAYLSGWGLRELFKDLNEKYPGKVRTFTHSMGSIVVSEALRLEAESGSPVCLAHTFVASQAATAAHCYDAVHPETIETDDTTDTPEVYAAYPLTGEPYYKNINLAAYKIVNFHNWEDDALEGWETQQDSKPDNGAIPSMNWYYNVGRWYRGIPPSTMELFFPEDRYEIFAHIAEARSYALGAAVRDGFTVQGPVKESFDLNGLTGFSKPEFRFGGEPEEHSAQFLDYNMIRYEYWETLKDRFGL